MRKMLLLSAVIFAAPYSVYAQTPPDSDEAPAANSPKDSDDKDSDDKTNDDAIVVTARKMDAARDSIPTSVGASQYTFSSKALEIQPSGNDASLKSVLLQAPGVTQDADGDGDIHVRNEHGNLQYRLNGVIVPESVAGATQTIDPHIANSVQLITGALPAQYGYRTAGIVALTTRTDSFDFDGDISLYGGSNGLIQPSVSIRDSVGSLNYFFSGSYSRSDMGISNPTSARTAIHDRSEEYRGFGYLSYILSDSSRITAFGGSSIGDFQIPNSAGEIANFTLNGRSTFDSTKLDQNKHSTTHYGVAAWQYTGDGLNVQIAPFVRYGKVHVTPDPNGGNLIFNGTETNLTLSSLAAGVQADASYELSPSHKLRFGLFFQNEHSQSNSITRVFAVDNSGAQSSDIPISIAQRGAKNGQLYGVYLQDEWQLADTLTLNYGLRYDAMRSYAREEQLSPRVGLVWKPSNKTTFHAGFARNFTPPPQELITSNTLSAFSGTTGAAEITLADPVLSERESEYDAGVQQQIAPGLTIGIDSYYKKKRNLLDEESLGATQLSSPFNYRSGHAWGIELSANYEHGPMTAYANIARGEEKARDIISNQFLFGADELSYIKTHDIYADHSQFWTASGGLSYSLEDGIGAFKPSIDFIYGDGLRAGDPAGIVPNGGKQQSYVQINLGLAQTIEGAKEDSGWTVRLDIINLFDKIYLLRDGSGVGAGQNEYGPRRGFFVGLKRGF